MSKKVQSTIALFVIVVLFAVISFVQLANVHTLKPSDQRDAIIQALLYMIPAVAAAVALLMLPFRHME